MKQQSNFGNELVRGPDDSGVDTRSHLPLEDHKLVAIHVLSATTLYIHSLIDPALSIIAQPEPQVLEDKYTQIYKEVLSNFEASPSWEMVSGMYRYTEQHDASDIDQMIGSNLETAFADHFQQFIRAVNIAQTMHELAPYDLVCKTHMRSLYLLTMRFQAHIKLDYPGSELAESLSCTMNTPVAGIGLEDFSSLADMKYGSVKALTSKEGLKRSGLITQRTSSGLIIELESARAYLNKLPGFRPTSGVTAKPASSTTPLDLAVNLPSVSELEKQAKLVDPELYANNFCFIGYNGQALFPVRVKNQDSGLSEFRLSAGGVGGNKKENTLFITEQTEVRQLVIDRGMAVRARAINDSKPPSLLKLGRTAVRAIYDFETQQFLSA